MANPSNPDVVSPSPWFKDASERVIVTIAQAAIGYLSAAALPDDYDPALKLIFGSLVAGAVSGIKAWVAKHIGNEDSASLVA